MTCYTSSINVVKNPFLISAHYTYFESQGLRKANISQLLQYSSHQE